jgi:predicted signal transduction protein with EAL and GGDEF domain
MYQSKAAGRNTLTFFDPAVQKAIIARAAMEKELSKAIKENQFQLYYQIQVDSAGQALGAEALIRWLHP